ncbi:MULTISPECIES: type IV pilus modification protein PilV [unclassified Acinetobacter]|uniref:type IV pilus modification protein PilV n=1 Tax=unclassified Acinetobacter TaxID=196816 RepID=UPI0015D41C33|nr:MULTISPECIES: type IV pilus modification protein PilV [unclassified Acinetobacter]
MKNQNGVGLMEVIIALLLLAISVLGYSLLQYRSLEAGGQALKKVEAMNLARNLGERMYVNKVAYSGIYKSGLSQKSDIANCKFDKDKIKYCAFTDFAKKDLADIAKLAEDKNMRVDVLPCPATKNGRSCIYVAWDETFATQSDDADSACTNVKEFTYKPNAKCIVVEAY